MPVQENVFTSSFVRQIPFAGSVPDTVWKPDGAPFQAGFWSECGFWHSDPAVVGRNSGRPEITNDDNCIIRCPQHTECVVALSTPLPG